MPRTRSCYTSCRATTRKCRKNSEAIFWLSTAALALRIRPRRRRRFGQGGQRTRSTAGRRPGPGTQRQSRYGGRQPARPRGVRRSGSPSSPMSDSTWSSRLARQSRWLLLAPVLAAISAASGQEPGDAGQDSKAEALKPLATGFARNILQDQKAIWTSPFHMTRKDARWWLTFGAIVGVAVATDRRSCATTAEYGGPTEVQSRHLAGGRCVHPDSHPWRVLCEPEFWRRVRSCAARDCWAARRSPMH